MIRFEYAYPDTLLSKSHGRIPFDPAGNGQHRRILEHKLDEWKATHPEARAASLEFIDSSRHVAVLVDRETSSVDDRPDGSLLIRLSAEQSKPGKGEDVRAVYEMKYPDHTLTVFHPYQGTALLERLDARTVTARSMIATELGLKDWDIRVDAQPDGGWRIRLDDGITYQPSRMDARMGHACLAVGRPGWWYEADAATGIILIHPGEPPTFLKSHPYPFDLLADPGYRDRTPLGVRLPKAGGMDWRTACVDWRESSFLLVGGEGGSGKSVGVNGMLAHIIAQRPRLAVVDLKNKSTDYYWARPWVTPGWWGCESPVEAAGVINRLVHEIEHGERARAWAENAWQNWLDIPRWAKEKYPLFYVLVDEYSSLVDKAKDVQRLPDPDKVLPPVIEKQYLGQAEADIRSGVLRLLRTARAQGYRLILISQTVNERSGLGPTTRDLFGHHMVMGPNPSEALVKSVFHDPTAVPDIPGNLYEDGVTKGVGRAELMGGRPFVFKTYWAGHDRMSDTEALGRAMVDRIGLPDGVDRDRYLDTLRAHGEDDPVDGRYMNWLTERIRIGETAALQSDPILAQLRQALDDSKANFGMGGQTPAMPADGGRADGGDDADAVAAPAVVSSPGPIVEASGPLRDARELARIMRQG